MTSSFPLKSGVLVGDDELKKKRTREYRTRVKERNESLQFEIASITAHEKKIVWEVGCGHGHFLVAYAKDHPRETCIGVDVVRDRVERARRKKGRAGLQHLYFLIADAGEFLTALPGGLKLSSIFVLFPDPWPKRRHHKNRLISPLFMDALSQRAGEGTRFYFRTDFEPYFLAVSALVRAHPKWELAEEPWPFESQTVFQARASHYFSLVARPAGGVT